VNLLRPYKTLAVGVILGAIVWPMVRGRVGVPGA
jgi:hypothetical protein